MLFWSCVYMRQPSYLCKVLFAHAPVLGLYFFVSVFARAPVLGLCFLVSVNGICF